MGRVGPILVALVSEEPTATPSWLMA
jgi:hypothetical protein